MRPKGSRFRLDEIRTGFASADNPCAGVCNLCNMRPFPKEWKVQVLFGFGESKPKGGTVKRLLLLMALCMALALVFAPVALAQDDLNCADLSEAEEQAVFDADPSDPNNLDDNDNGVPCENDDTDNGSFALPRDDDDNGADEDQYGVDEDQYGVGGSQYETETSPTTVSPSAELPETGGPSFVALALPTMALLIASGLLTLRIVRR